MDTETKTSTSTETLAEDAVRGLSSKPRYLLSKYFYDDEGSAIFRDIMNMPEYYLTDCEVEIFNEQSSRIAQRLAGNKHSFDLIELGSGDGSKTRILISAINKMNLDFRYIPVDISKEANRALKESLKAEFPELKVKPVTADFLNLSHSFNGLDSPGRVFLFLGSNIGNFSNNEMDSLFNTITGPSSVNDKVLIGFDLKKDPAIILDAYDDKSGHTKRFNLNHLKRLNRELDADFDLDAFEHYTSYNPQSGVVSSYLVSLKDQVVRFGSTGNEFNFKKWEAIFMERSRKFDTDTIVDLAEKYGFRVLENFTDNKKWFTDSLWIKK